MTRMHWRNISRLLNKYPIHVWHRHPAFALAPMAVHPNHQNQGVGAQWVRDGFAACKSAGHQALVVLGHPEFYTRFEFLRASQYGIAAPFDVPEDAFLVQALIPDGRNRMHGIVRYPSVS